MWLGIDFSGNADSWRPGRPRNVWIAEIDGDLARPGLRALHPVQAMAGSGSPFQRLVERLRRRDFAAAGIDAPFSIPRAYLPAGGRAALLAAVDRLPIDPDRPFPRGQDFVAAITASLPLAEKRPFRATERAWIARGVNTRSSLWAGPRGGAPFTAACLKLLACAGLEDWPWAPGGEALLAEVFPAAQLRQWGLPYQKYGLADPLSAANRGIIVTSILERVRCEPEAVEVMRRNADALDAVLCGFGAIAVTSGRMTMLPPDGLDDEGWIAVHA